MQIPRMNPQQLLTMALNRCNDPNIINIIQNSRTPQQAVQELCKRYPNVAQQIDSVIGQGNDPQQIAMNMFNRK